MAKNWWQDDDDDDDDWADETPEDKLQRERAEMQYDLGLRGVNQTTLAQRFCEICERQKKLDNDRLEKRGRLASEIEKDLASCEKQKNKLSQEYRFFGEIESIIKNYLVKRNKDSYSAWRGLQLDIETLERTLRDYESRGDENTPEYVAYTKKLKVMNTLAKMKTDQQVEKYLGGQIKQGQEIQNKIDECEREINAYKQELNNAGKAKVSAQDQEEWKKEEICLKCERIAFVRDMKDFAFARPQNELVKSFEEMIGSAYFFSGEHISIATMNEYNLDNIVHQVAGGKITNLLATKNTDTGR